MSDLKPRQPNRPLIWSEFVLALQALLRNDPAEIYVVGGAVRDAMLHRPLHDIDLATSGAGIQLAREIANHFNGDFFALDAERDVGRALVDTSDGRLVLDAAHFRGPTLQDDLVDRDFTINAMAVDIKDDLSLIVDPLGGEQDIVARQIRQCAPDALPNDPVRALRAVRQSIQLGMRIEPETLRQIREVISQLSRVSPERIRDEWIKILALPRPAAAIRVADATGLLAAVVPEVVPLHGWPQPAPQVFDAWEYTLAVVENLNGILATISYTRTDNTAASFSFGMIAIQLDRFRKALQDHVEKVWPNQRPHRALLMLAALLHDAGLPASTKVATTVVATDFEVIGAKMADARAEALRLSNAERQRLVVVVQYHQLPLQLEDLEPKTLHRFWRQTGEAGVDICLFAMAEYLATYGSQLHQGEWLKVVERVRTLLEAYYEKYEQLVEPPVLLDGNQLIKKLDLKPSPLVGRLLDHIREAQVAGEVSSADDALRLARAYLNTVHDS